MPGRRTKLLLEGWEHPAYYYAKKNLSRIFRNRAQKCGGDVAAAYASRAKIVQEALLTRIDTCSIQEKLKR
jgi:hypothetical protein